MKLLLLLLVIAIAPLAIVAQIKKPLPPAVRPAFEKSRQMLVVTTGDWSAVKGEARLFERKSARSAWKAAGDEFPVVVGRNGLAVAADSTLSGWTLGGMSDKPATKREGDGKAPAGFFPLTFAFGAGSKPGGVRLPFTELKEFTECVDDVRSNHYNRVVDRMQVGNVDWKSSEKMLEVGAQYERGIFVAYNSYPPVAGYGSCIFLHIWKDANTGTSGCTAMERGRIEWLLTKLDLAKTPYLAQMPADQYETFRSKWKLPKLK